MSEKKRPHYDKFKDQLFVFGETLFLRHDGKITRTPLALEQTPQGRREYGYNKSFGHIRLADIDPENPEGNAALDAVAGPYAQSIGGTAENIKEVVLRVAGDAKLLMELGRGDIEKIKDEVDTALGKSLEMQWIHSNKNPVIHGHFDPNLKELEFNRTSDRLFQGYPAKNHGSAGGRDNHMLVAGTLSPREYFMGVIREEYGHLADRLLGQVEQGSPDKFIKHASYFILKDTMATLESDSMPSIEKLKSGQLDELLKPFDLKPIRRYSAGIYEAETQDEQRQKLAERIEDIAKLPGYEDSPPHWRATEHMVKFHVLRQELEDMTTGHGGDPRAYLQNDMAASPALRLLDAALPELSKAYREQWLPKVKERVFADLGINDGPKKRGDGQSWADATAERASWKRG